MDESDLWEEIVHQLNKAPGWRTRNIFRDGTTAFRAIHDDGGQFNVTIKRAILSLVDESE